MERVGLPAVIIVQDRFEAAAKANKRLMKLREARVVVIQEGSEKHQHGTAGAVPYEEQKARVDDVWDQIIGALVDES